MFDRVEREIINRQLFLQPDFSREELIKIIYIPKNKFAQLFKLYARTSFSKYVNNLRLEYAAGMLKEHPYYTIDAIAKECGMSTVQTFYRLFSEKFGVTPTEFRSGLKISENECNND
ncbi:AraC family transcriptional regulator [Bacteroides faecis]|nr:AraC family transcriptional regulator [Bacteroides faecis]MCS2194843.1 AraC family transcriptional regulator [Bacteroides faecis]